MDLAELVAQVTAIKPAGDGRYVARCPFHQERTPSFSINSAKGFYHCFGCGKSGDVFRFVMETEHVAFPEAVRILAGKAGMELPRQNTPVDPRRRILGVTQEFYQLTLAGAPRTGDGWSYIGRRGLTAEDLSDWGIGLAPDGWDTVVKHLHSRGYTDADILATGVAQRTRDGKRLVDRFRGRLTFAIRGVSGGLIGFGARSLDGSEPKYLNSPETDYFHKKEALYGIERARNEIIARGHALIVEGYFDVIAMHRAGQRNTVAGMGTAFSPEQAALLKRFTDKVKLLYDRDPAGTKAQERSVEILWEAGFEVKIAVLPVGLDPDDLIKGYSNCSIQEILIKSLTPVEYFLNPEQNDIGTRREYGRHLESIMVKVSDTVYREALFEEYSHLIRVPKEHLRTRLEAYNDTHGEVVQAEHVASRTDPTERFLAYLVAFDIRFAYDTCRLLSVAEVESDLLKTMLQALCDKECHGEMGIDELKAIWEELGIESQLAELANDPQLVLKNGSDPYFILLEVKSRALRKKLDALSNRLQKEESATTGSVDALINELSATTKLLQIIRTAEYGENTAKKAVESIIGSPKF